MNDNELAVLRDRITDLESRLNQHEGMRSGAIDALSIVQTHVERLQRRMTAIPPAVEAAREGSMLEKYAVLATRVHATEEWITDMAKIVVEDHEAICEILGLLRRNQ